MEDDAIELRLANVTALIITELLVLHTESAKPVQVSSMGHDTIF